MRGSLRSPGKPHFTLLDWQAQSNSRARRFARIDLDFATHRSCPAPHARKAVACGLLRRVETAAVIAHPQHQHRAFRAKFDDGLITIGVTHYVVNCFLEYQVDRAA